MEIKSFKLITLEIKVLLITIASGTRQMIIVCTWLTYDHVSANLLQCCLMRAIPLGASLSPWRLTPWTSTLTVPLPTRPWWREWWCHLCCWLPRESNSSPGTPLLSWHCDQSHWPVTQREMMTIQTERNIEMHINAAKGDGYLMHKTEGHLKWLKTAVCAWNVQPYLPFMICACRLCLV